MRRDQQGAERDGKAGPCMEKEGCLPELEKDAGAPGPSVEEIIAREMDYHGGQ